MQHGVEQEKTKETMKAPCANCGKPISIGKGSLAAGQSTCHPCRRDLRIDICVIYPRNCLNCERPFIARHKLHGTCSPDCRKNWSDDYHRWKRNKRRVVTRESDITPRQEADIRKRARKCTLCSVYMTGKVGKPNTKHLDHIIPINIGGTHTHGNVRIICRTCNLARPKDGSDYTGPVTLWAQVADVMMPQPKIKLVTPKPEPKPRPIAGSCIECGDLVYVASRQGQRCHGCLMVIGARAAAMRDAGMKWKEICDALCYPNTGSLYQLAITARYTA
jgi:hypothetical protein